MTSFSNPLVWPVSIARFSFTDKIRLLTGFAITGIIFSYIQLNITQGCFISTKTALGIIIAAEPRTAGTDNRGSLKRLLEKISQSHSGFLIRELRKDFIHSRFGSSLALQTGHLATCTLLYLISTNYTNTQFLSEDSDTCILFAVLYNKAYFKIQKTCLLILYVNLER